MSRFAASLVVVVAVGLLLAGCGGGATGGTTTGPAVNPAATPVASGDSCADYLTWREAQDALEAEPDVNADLDSDGDGVACSAELGQPEYDEAWSEAYPEACAGVFDESSTGALYGTMAPSSRAPTVKVPTLAPASGRQTQHPNQPTMDIATVGVASQLVVYDDLTGAVSFGPVGVLSRRRSA